MRKVVLGLAACAVLAACGGGRGFDRARPDEFAVARQAPLVIPPDYALVPPQPGAARPQDAGQQGRTLEALFGPNQARSPAEAALVDQAGARAVEPGIRSTVGDPATNVVDKGAATRDIVSAPESDGRDARASAGAGTAAPAAGATAPAAGATPR